MTLLHLILCSFMLNRAPCWSENKTQEQELLPSPQNLSHCWLVSCGESRQLIFIFSHIHCHPSWCNRFRARGLREWVGRAARLSMCPGSGGSLRAQMRRTHLTFTLSTDRDAMTLCRVYSLTIMFSLVAMNLVPADYLSSYTFHLPRSSLFRVWQSHSGCPWG